MFGCLCYYFICGDIVVPITSRGCSPKFICCAMIWIRSAFIQYINNDIQKKNIVGFAKQESAWVDAEISTQYR